MATLAEIETADQQKQADKERRAFGARTIRDIQAALETAGVEFLDDGQSASTGGAGVRLKATAGGASQAGE